MKNQCITSFFLLIAVVNFGSANATFNTHYAKSTSEETVSLFNGSEAVGLHGRATHKSKSQLELAASGSLEISSISAHAGDVLLISGSFTGTLFWGKQQFESQGAVHGFVMITRLNGHSGEGRLLWCEPHLIPNRAWPTPHGFQVLARDEFYGDPILVNLDKSTRKVENPLPPENGSQGVTQPEDLPEGTGG